MLKSCMAEGCSMPIALLWAGGGDRIVGIHSDERMYVLPFITCDDELGTCSAFKMENLTVQIVCSLGLRTVGAEC